MPENRETIKQYDSLIQEAGSLKLNLQAFKRTLDLGTFRPQKVLIFLIAATDHIINNLTDLKHRHITDLEGG